MADLTPDRHCFDRWLSFYLKCTICHEYYLNWYKKLDRSLGMFDRK
ncbi:MAG: hypothetical protein ACRC11_07890 [Xenococcaceae cyanobacterium]